MKKYQSIDNHDDLLEVVDGVLEEAGLDRKELDGKITFAGMDPIRPTSLAARARTSISTSEKPTSTIAPGRIRS